nr:MAG TPA: hypothetical protein [Caudoviricetes sp.]
MLFHFLLRIIKWEEENEKREYTPPTAKAFNVGGSNSHYLYYNL